MIFASSTKVRGTSLESSLAANKKSAGTVGGRTVQTRSLNESRQQIIGDFLPKVDSTGVNTAGKLKEKMNVTHYYTQTSGKLKDN